MKRIFNETYIDEAAQAITAALRPLLANCGGSLVNEAIATTAAYRTGLNSGEVHLAVQRALGLLQVEETAKFAGLLFDEEDDEDFFYTPSTSTELLPSA